MALKSLKNNPNFHQEILPLYDQYNDLVAGVDEAGRGPLAGPVFAAAVILNPVRPIEGLADSKKISAKKREYLFDEINDKALCVAVGSASVQEIDEMNILQATLLAMRRSVQNLRLKPKLLLIDGNQIPRINITAHAIVKGDALIPAVSAASIIAKVTRDRWCEQAALRWSMYGFEKHKGYGTVAHLAALREHGACPEHRKSFAPIANLKVD